MLHLLCLLALSSAYTCPVSIKYSVFANISTSTNGGVIYLSTVGCILSISRSLFLNDSTTQYGGAIYSDNGTVAINSTCFVSCNVGQRGFAIYTTCISNASLNLVSVYRCYSLNTANGANSIQFIAVNISVNNANFTFNSAGEHTTTVWNYASSYSHWTFTTVDNNTDTLGATMNCRGPATNYVYSNINVVNSIRGNNWGLLFFDEYDSGVEFVNCDYINNGNNTFLSLGSTSPSAPTFIGCTFDILLPSLSIGSETSCVFGASNSATYWHNYINLAKCSIIDQSETFTAEGKALKHSLASIGSLYIILSLVGD